MNQKSIVDQVEVEYKIAQTALSNKLDKWRTGLKLYNNQKRDVKKFGDPLLFTVHNTLLSALYDDQLQVEFAPAEHGDKETADNLNNLYKHDFYETNKPDIDYEWSWDALFFGYGIVLLHEFDKETKTPVPKVLDPMNFLVDPSASNVKTLRFCGRYFYITKRELEDSGLYKDYKNLEWQSIANSETDKTARERNQAIGITDIENYEQELKGANARIQALEWFTYLSDGLYLLVLVEPKGGGDKKIIRKQKIKGGMPFIKRSAYPNSKDWFGVSVLDLVEDKQRMKASLLNLVHGNIRYAEYPDYFYDQNKIHNPADLTRTGQQKHIPVSGDPNTVIAEKRKHRTSPDVQWFLDTVDNLAQRATSTPTMQQGMGGSGGASATETSLMAQNVDKRYGLSVKMFMQSEIQYARQWYFIYKAYFEKDIYSKNMRINNASGMKFRKLTRENIISKKDPDVNVESTLLAKAERAEKLQIISNLLAQSEGVNFDRRFALKEMAKYSGLQYDQINRLYPPTHDELLAREENEKLEKGEYISPQIEENHSEHLREHSKANDTKALQSHIKKHLEALKIIQKNPNLLTPEQTMEAKGQGEQLAPTDQRPASQSIDYSSPNTLQTANG